MTIDCLERITCPLLIAGALSMSLLSGCGRPWPSLLDPPLNPPARAERRGQSAGVDAALVISVEDYAHLTDIRGANENAEAWRVYFRETLALPESRVHVLRDRMSTRGRIERKIDDVVASLDEGERLWLVFIGHGTVLEDGTGVLVAVDAERASTSIAENSVPLPELLRRVRGVDHVALIDACFSGLDRGGGAHDPDKQFVTKLDPLEHRAQGVVITATGPEETAGQLRHGRRPAFSYLALSALRGWADEMPTVGNHDSRLTAGELAGAVKAALDKVNDHRPTPQVYPPKARDYVLVEKARDPLPAFDYMVENSPAVRHDGWWLGAIGAVFITSAVLFNLENHAVFTDVQSKLDAAGRQATSDENATLSQTGYLSVAGYTLGGLALGGLVTWLLMVPEDDGGLATHSATPRSTGWAR